MGPPLILALLGTLKVSYFPRFLAFRGDDVYPMNSLRLH